MNFYFYVQKALFYYLERFCCCATIITKLANFVSEVVQNESKSNRTYEAFASSLAIYLNQVRSKILQIEKTAIHQGQPTFFVYCM